MKTTKEAEIASFSLRYIAIPRNCQKLLVTENAKKLNQLKSVMTKCVDICLQNSLKHLKGAKPFSDKSTA